LSCGVGPMRAESTMLEYARMDPLRDTILRRRVNNDLRGSDCSTAESPGTHFRRRGQGTEATCTEPYYRQS
jgi:hypothetical protein